eukprot:15453469-Alexandrium_andersonii.AAC.1
MSVPLFTQHTRLQMYAAPAPTLLANTSHTSAGAWAFARTRHAYGLRLKSPHPFGIRRGAWHLHLCDFGRGARGSGCGSCVTSVGSQSQRP